MGRYTGPTERFSRREGVELELKGGRRLARKGGLDRRGPTPPGEHRRAARRPSIYAQQLREKQRLKRYYGVREAQLRHYVRAARRGETGTLGERLMVALERRLDNVLYRLGLASTRAQARQFITHRHLLVNGRRVDIPSFAVSPGDVIEFRIDSGARPAAEAAADQMGRVAAWLTAEPDSLRGAVIRFPTRDEIDAPIDEQRIVEHYARLT